MIRIAGAVWESIIAHARCAYPEECCGALLGAEGRVEAALALDNVAIEAHRFELRPDDLVRAEGEARARGLRLTGIYHSHPDSGAELSEADLENACPWLFYLVLSLGGGELVEARAWLPDRVELAVWYDSNSPPRRGPGRHQSRVNSD
jgi:proteasome lid subunit RPN8/RPN11